MFNRYSLDMIFLQKETQIWFSHFVIPELLDRLKGTLVGDVILSQASSTLRNLGELLVLFLGECPAEDVEILLHPFLVEALHHHANLQLVRPSQADLTRITTHFIKQ